MAGSFPSVGTAVANSSTPPPHPRPVPQSIWWNCCIRFHASRHNSLQLQPRAQRATPRICNSNSNIAARHVYFRESGASVGEGVCHDNFTEMHAFKHHQSIVEEYNTTREPRPVASTCDFCAIFRPHL